MADKVSLTHEQQEAISEIDWNVIMMIGGTMGTVYLFIESKMPQLMSDILLSKMLLPVTFSTSDESTCDPALSYSQSVPLGCFLFWSFK